MFQFPKIKNLAESLDQLSSREGAHAIYIERPIIALVRVTGVRGNDSGVGAHIELVHTPGMREEDTTSADLGADWDIFSNFDDRWHAIYVNWSLYFGADTTLTLESETPVRN